MIRVFTSAAPNYLGKVRTLFSSLKKHHPEFALHLVLADLPPLPTDAEAEGIQSVLSLADLATDDRAWLFSHSTVELCTAIKARALELLLAEDDTEAVLYLDPDIVLFSRLDDLLDRLRESSIVLTPHLLEPETELDAILDNEICALRHGVFNLGFAGVRNTAEGRRFVSWWGERLNRFCRAEPETGLFTDQKWMDFAPCYFGELHVLRDSRFNVAPWNLSRRRVAGNFDQGFTVDGKPLGFYHFTGFDSGAHDAMMEKYAPGNRALRMLAEWYRRRSRALSPEAPPDWRLGCFSDGAPIQPIHRHLYRRRPDLSGAFPDPFFADGFGSYRHWFEHQAPEEYPELRYLERDETLNQVRWEAVLEREMGKRERALDLLRGEFESSTSWRLSSPVRLVGRLLKRAGLAGAS
jgi:hypothetical protein